MFDKVWATVAKYHMFENGDKVLVGVSGGPDSIALAHIMYKLAQEIGLELLVAHLNHCLRGQESEEDAAFVRDFAANLGVAAVIEEKDVAGHAVRKRASIQTAAREIRYQFFYETAQKLGCNKLATGHNANDQAETVLFHFLRGSGPAGLKGIPPVRDGWITRPLIEVDRAMIERYCHENGLASRLDRSNLKTNYTRNRLRLSLIPQLQVEYNPNLVETLVRTSEVFREEEEFIEECARGHLRRVIINSSGHNVTCDLVELLQVPVIIQKRIIREAWLKVSAGLGHLGFIHLNKAVEFLVSAQTGSRLTMPGGVVLTKGYQSAVLSPLGEAEDDRGYIIEVNIPGVTKIPGGEFSLAAELLKGPIPPNPLGGKNTIIIDLDMLKCPLRIRTRKPGDWFKPVGLSGSKKLKKYLIDSKIPRQERQKLAVLVTGDDQLVWLVGLRADERWLAGGDTQRALKLQLIQNT